MDSHRVKLAKFQQNLKSRKLSMEVQLKLALFGVNKNCVRSL